MLRKCWLAAAELSVLHSCRRVSHRGLVRDVRCIRVVVLCLAASEKAQASMYKMLRLYHFTCFGGCLPP